jgi:hypothetical protein
MLARPNESAAVALRCRNVVERGAPILYVSHDRDGDWQVLCGGNEYDDSAQAVISHLEHFVEADASLLSLADLAAGFYAERTDVRSPWMRRKSEDDHERSDECECGREHDGTKGEDGFDDDERTCIENVRRFGLNILRIGPGHDDDGFAYSVGLFHRYEHPEIIVFGQKPDWQGAMLNVIAERIREGERFREGVPYTDLLEGYACRFRAVRARESYDAYLGWDLWYYSAVSPLESLVPVLQFVWPDKDGRFPDAAGYVGYRQPLIP